MPSVSPEPVSPEPVSPEPVSPEPVSPEPVSPELSEPSSLEVIWSTIYCSIVLDVNLEALLATAPAIKLSSLRPNKYLNKISASVSASI